MWWHIPEPQLRPFVAMMPRLLAEQSRQRVQELLAANGRLLKDQHQRQFLAQLDRDIAGGDGRPRGTRMSIDQLERSGMRVVREQVRAAPAVTGLKPGQRPGMTAPKEERKEVKHE